MDKPEFSVVAPMHNEEINARLLYNAIKETMERLGRTYEIIFTNDYSSDSTLAVFKEIAQSDPLFHYCDLEYNVGENWALLAAISKAQGNVIVSIDGDFQNDPRYIPDLIIELEKGYRVVSGRRRQRKENWTRRVLPSLIANGMIAIVSGVPVHDTGCGLKAYRRDVVEGKFVPKGFMNRFSPVALGVKRSEFSEVVIEDRPRTSGSSHYGLERTFIVFNDLLALPFALRGPKRLRPWFVCLTAVFSGLIIFSLKKNLFLPAAGALLLALACFSIQWNLKRFIEAQENPRFKIKEFR